MVLLDNGGRVASELDLLSPPADLAPIVEHLWVQRGHPAAANWRVVADSSPHLIAAVSADDRSVSMRVALVGARSHAATIDVRNRTLTVGVRFRAGALPVLSNVSARELVDRSLLLADVVGAGPLRGLELAPDAPPALVVHELVRLTRRICRGPAGRSTWGPELLAWTNTVAQLAHALRMPTRSLLDRAYREVGLSPKHILRVARLHAALLAARRRDRPWAQVAYEVGYADQAHFTREVRALLGETPSQWAARGSAVSFKTINGGSR